MAGNIWSHAFLGSKNEPFDAFVALFDRDGAVAVRRVDGVFATVMIAEEGRIFAARDAYGVVPMVWWRGADGTVGFANEASAAPNDAVVADFPPGHVYTGPAAGVATEAFTAYFEPSWTAALRASDDYHRVLVRQYVVAAVDKRVNHDQQQRAYLVSGGAASAALLRAAQDVDADLVLHSYAVGFDDSADLLAAATVANEVGAVHHQIKLLVDDALDYVPVVVRLLRCAQYGVVADAVPLYLLMKSCARDGAKVLLSGHGAAETWGPHGNNDDNLLGATACALLNAHATHARMVNVLAAHVGVEARLPFFDVNAVEVAMNIAPPQKRPRMHLLANDDQAAAALPPPCPMHVGVGQSWAEALDVEATERGFATAEAWFDAELNAVVILPM